MMIQTAFEIGRHPYHGHSRIHCLISYRILVWLWSFTSQKK
jgi:hypothetical protein